MDKIVKQSLKRRGYTVYKNEEPEDDFHFVIPFLNGNKKGKVFYPKKDKIGLEDLGNIFRPFIVSPSETDLVYHIIIIYKNITSPAINSFKDNISHFIFSELIEDTYFRQDIMSHPLVSEYKKLTKEEKEQVMATYKTTSDLFPQMLTSDPVSIVMGFRDGEMIQVSCYYNFTKKCIDKEMPPSITYVVITDKCE